MQSEREYLAKLQFLKDLKAQNIINRGLLIPNENTNYLAVFGSPPGANVKAKSTLAVEFQ